MSEGRALLKPLAVAAGIGIPVSLIALLFLAAVHELEKWLWEGLPGSAGFDGYTWWWILLVPTVGGALSALVVRRLPGHGGHEPIQGFSADPTPPAAIPGVALAALASLPFGAVLGPEAPLIALGGALGLLAARTFRVTGELAPLAAAGGLFASIAALFGNPLVAAFLIVEVLAMHSAPALAVILPGMLAAGLGYLVFTGVGNWAGLTAPTFAAPGLPDYPTVRLVDLVAAVVLAVVMTGVIVLVRRLARRTYAALSKRPLVWGPAAGLLVGACAALFGLASGASAELVLFSGESATETVITQAGTLGVGVLALALVAKSLAYAVSLGSLFRGGAIFPAVYLGVVAGMLTHELVPAVSPTAAAVAGMAAASTAILRLPLTSVLLAILVAGAPGLEATTLALIAAAVALIAVRAVDARSAAGGDAAAPGPAANATRAGGSDGITTA
jgi:H+/Cl- antiporter ClcA